MTVRVEGLKELRRALKAVEGGSPKEVTAVLRDAAGDVARKAASNAPKKSGNLAGSIKIGTRGTSAFVRSNLPYAAVHEYGGNVGPNKRTHIKASKYMTNAIHEETPRIVDKLGEGIERVMRRNGF